MTAIDKRIFKERHFAATPEAVSPAILALCREISPSHRPVYVSCRPEGPPAECFHNVRHKVERDGGALLNGWAIWEWRSVFIEAEHHAVWESAGGLMDVTQHVPVDEERILLLPDPERAYDEAGARLINIKRTLGLIPQAQSWLDAADALQRYQESCTIGRVVRMQRDILWAHAQHVEQAHGAVLDSLARRTRPNDRCICRSGLKYKKCCGPYIDLHSHA